MAPVQAAFMSVSLSISSMNAFVNVRYVFMYSNDGIFNHDCIDRNKLH